MNKGNCNCNAKKMHQKGNGSHGYLIEGEFEAAFTEHF